jgi:hypothetical protein
VEDKTLETRQKGMNMLITVSMPPPGCPEGVIGTGEVVDERQQ